MLLLIYHLFLLPVAVWFLTFLHIVNKIHAQHQRWKRHICNKLCQHLLSKENHVKKICFIIEMLTFPSLCKHYIVTLTYDREQAAKHTHLKSVSGSNSCIRLWRFEAPCRSCTYHGLIYEFELSWPSGRGDLNLFIWRTEINSFVG